MRKLLMCCLPFLMAGCVVESATPFYVYNEPVSPRVIVKENRVHRHRAPQVVVTKPRVKRHRRPIVVVKENRIKPHQTAANRIGQRKPNVRVSNNRIKRRTDSQAVIQVPLESRVRIS